MKKVFSAVVAVLAFCLALNGAIPQMWRTDAPAAVMEKNGKIALVNRKTAVVFEGKTFALQAIYHAGMPDNRIIANTPLWSARMLSVEYADGPKEPVFRNIDSSKVSQVKLNSGKNPDGSVFIRAVCNGPAVKNLRYTAVITVSLRPDEEMPRWNLHLDAGRKNVASLWTVDFPRISFKVDPENPPRMVLPYRTGILSTYPHNFAMPYPGAAVKFQMMSFYDEISGDGGYLGCGDDDGFSKCFRVKCLPKNGEALFSLTHYPVDRFNAVSFKPAYEVLGGARKGDWFDDAVRYRKWFVSSKYAARGPMIFRKDVPGWLKEAVMSAKISTNSKNRNVENNVRGAEKIVQLTKGAPVLAIWYEFEQRKGFYDNMGRVTPAREGVPEALKAMKKQNFHVLGYVQSQIYNPDGSPEMDEVEKYMIRDFFGNLAPYHGIVACRMTPWWQQRFCELSQHALDLGFEGIYLDSFGKGNAECFRDNHGHGQGGGNYVIRGQRMLAAKLRAMLKKANPEYVMSGEAPVEAFTDLLDYYLLAVNVMPDGIPLWRAIAGDYIICHGRMMTPGPKKDSIVGETAELFLNGTIPGRLSFYGGSSFFDRPEFAAEKAFVEKILQAVPPTLEYLRMGEMCRIPELFPEPAKVRFHEYIKGKEVIRPGVLARVYRSHKDGSRCAVLVNISDTPWQGKVKLAPADGGKEVIMQVNPRDITWKIIR